MSRMSTRTKLAWVAVLYFAEGLPYGLIFDTFNAYLSTQGVTLRDIGLAASASLPWTIKFLWAPAVDLWGERRHWFVACQAVVALALVAAIARPPAEAFATLWVLLLVIAFAAATQDVAIDAYTIELIDQKEIGPANGVRQTAYRVAIITAGGPLLWLADQSGWPTVFFAAATLFVALAFISASAPKVVRPESPDRALNSTTDRLEEAVITPFLLFLRHRGVSSCLGMLAFVLLFRVGEYALGPMVTPFRVQRGLSLKEIGFMVGVLSPACTVAGALLAGWLTTRLGIFRALWLLGLFQGASNLAYSAAALSPMGLKWPLYAASAVESFCSGLGSTPFMAFLMVICTKSHAATQFALLTALFNVTGLIARASSGILTEWLGFAPYFTATFALSFISYLFLPWVRQWTPFPVPGPDHSQSRHPE